MEENHWVQIWCRFWRASTCEVRSGYGVGLWKCIKKEWETILRQTFFSIGDDRRVSFKRDQWCGEMVLTFLPCLFALAVEKEATMADV